MESIPIIQELIEHENISMKTRRVPENPILNPGQYPKDIKHYRCRLLKPAKQMDAYLSVDADDGAPTLPDVIFMLTMDASGCKMLTGFDELRMEWAAVFDGADGALNELEDFWREYKARSRQAEEFKRFIGRSAYERLLQDLSVTTGFSQIELDLEPLISEHFG